MNSYLNLGPLTVRLHRTVRVKDDAQPANLPPNLGDMELFRASDYSGVPSGWPKDALFTYLQDTEAMWMSFRSSPVALVVGAGGINALNGELLGPSLVKGGYLVTPPQPWLDGWKGQDGTVYQFVATRYEKGSGKTVGEQLIGADSKTGAIGFAVHLLKPGVKIQTYESPEQLIGGVYESPGFMKGQSSVMAYASAAAPRAMASFGEQERSVNLAEMGLGKGGKIIQKIYEDPHGLDVWQPLANHTGALFLVGAEAFSLITGRTLEALQTQENYGGKWFGLKDGAHSDVKGTAKFDGLKPVPEQVDKKVFPGS